MTCRACASAALTEVFRATGVPVENSRLYDDREAALAVPTGDLVLTRCERCGFVQNDAFDPKAVTYDAAYEDSQAHSPYFRAFADRVISELLDRYELREKRVLEIGCGRGDFLEMYCRASGGTGIGIDPSAIREAGIRGDIEIRAELFDDASTHHDADVVICRHTLEHVHEPAAFLLNLRRAFDGRPETVLYLEVPDTGRIADEGAFWDLYYEHCSYFDEESLVGLARRTGWEPIECRLDYGGQYLLMHARPRSSSSEIVGTAGRLDFSGAIDGIGRWARWASDQHELGHNVALWAASSKAVSFMSLVPELRPVVAVDINPSKKSRFLPGSGLEVGGPDDLPSYRISIVVAMNPIYVDEIRQDLRSRNLNPLVIFADRLPPDPSSYSDLKESW